MKKIPIFILIIFLFISCRKNNGGETVNDFTLTTIPGWPTIDFKTNYTIQLPVGFSGGVQPGFEGNTFNAVTQDEKIKVYFEYSNSLFAVDFADTLKTPIPTRIQIVNNFSQLIILDQIAYFKQGSENIGILYYSKSEPSRGRLFWKDKGVLKDALEIDFNLSELETVNKIIQSVKRK